MHFTLEFTGPDRHRAAEIVATATAVTVDDLPEAVVGLFQDLAAHTVTTVAAYRDAAAGAGFPSYTDPNSGETAIFVQVTRPDGAVDTVTAQVDPQVHGMLGDCTGLQLAGLWIQALQSLLGQGRFAEPEMERAILACCGGAVVAAVRAEPKTDGYLPDEIQARRKRWEEQDLTSVPEQVREALGDVAEMFYSVAEGTERPLTARDLTVLLETEHGPLLVVDIVDGEAGTDLAVTSIEPQILLGLEAMCRKDRDLLQDWWVGALRDAAVAEGSAGRRAGSYERSLEMNARTPFRDGNEEYRRPHGVAVRIIGAAESD